MATQKKQSGPRRHAPMRTCVGCRSGRPKREMVRVVATVEGVQVDPTGKKSGRGAYLCRSRSCWDLGLKKERLAASLRAVIDAPARERLRQYAETLPPTESDGPGSERGEE